MRGLKTISARSWPLMKPRRSGRPSAAPVPGRSAAFILQWKINQALHRQQGGRITYQQGGPGPRGCPDTLHRFSGPAAGKTTRCLPHHTGIILRKQQGL
jgi:hypothetical protein